MKLSAARGDLGIGKLPRYFVEAEAMRQQRVEDIPNYVTAHAFTHGAYSALKYRVTHHDPAARSTFHMRQDHNVELLESAANFAGRSALLGFRSGYRIFELDEPESFGRLLFEIEFAEVEAVE